MKNIKDEIELSRKNGTYKTTFKPITTTIQDYKKENRTITRITVDLERVAVTEGTETGVSKRYLDAVLQVASKTHPDKYGKQLKVGDLIVIANDGKIGKEDS